jgi:hypothetical protein
VAQEEAVKVHRPLAAQGNMTAALEADLRNLLFGKAVSTWHFLTALGCRGVGVVGVRSRAWRKDCFCSLRVLRDSSNPQDC